MGFNGFLRCRDGDWDGVRMGCGRGRNDACRRLSPSRAPSSFHPDPDPESVVAPSRYPDHHIRIRTRNRVHAGEKAAYRIVLPSALLSLSSSSVWTVFFRFHFSA